MPAPLYTIKCLLASPQTRAHAFKHPNLHRRSQLFIGGGTAVLRTGRSLQVSREFIEQHRQELWHAWLHGQLVVQLGSAVVDLSDDSLPVGNAPATPPLPHPKPDSLANDPVPLQVIRARPDVKSTVEHADVPQVMQDQLIENAAPSPEEFDPAQTRRKRRS